MSNTLHPFPTHVWKRVQGTGGGRRRGGARGRAGIWRGAASSDLQADARLLQRIRKRVGDGAWQGVVELWARPVGPRTLCIYSQTVDAS